MLLAAALLLPAIVLDQQPAADAEARESAAAKQRLAKLDFFRGRLRDGVVRPAGDAMRPFTFVERPLFQFDNAISGIEDGFVFIWIDRGRPVVLMKSYYNSQRASWGRTYVSLANKPIEMRQREQSRWTPKEPGVSFQPIKNAAPPAGSARGRLKQMRELAARFRVVDRWGLVDPTDWQLRLLPAPLYRYEVPDEHVVDGALFGYVLSGSPEAVVLLEAKEITSGLEWHFAVSRATRFGITIWLDEEKIAEYPRLDAWPASGVYFHDPLPLPDYPFRRDD